MNRAGAAAACIAVVALVAVIAWVTLKGEEPSAPDPEPEIHRRIPADSDPVHAPGIPDDPDPVVEPVREVPPDSGREDPPSEVHGSFTGVVLGPDGEPAAGVEVYRIAVAKAGERHLLGAISTTDEKGRFRLASEAGTFDVGFYRPDWLPLLLLDRTVASGRVLDLGEVRMEAGKSVSGEVVDTEGGAVEGATVLAYRDDTVVWRGLVPGRLSIANWWSRAKTDAAGRFEAGGLSPEPVFLKATRFDVTMEGPPPKVSPGVTGVRLVVRRLRLATGRVVVEGTDLSVSGATVSLALRTLKFGETLRYRSLADGRFAFDLSPDRYRDPSLELLELRVSATGYEDAVRQEPTLEELLPEAEFRIPLVRATPVDPGRLTGRVRYDTGEPFFGSLTLSFSGGDGAARIFRVATDEEGAFTLEEVPPGDYKLLSAPRNRTLLAETGRRLVITPGGEETVEFTIIRGGDLDVSVVGETGAPIAGGSVAWRSPARDETGEEPVADGVARIRDLPAGPVKLTVTAPGHRAESRDLDVIKAQGQSITVRLRED